MAWFLFSIFFLTDPPAEPVFDLQRITTSVEPFRVVYRGRIVGCVDYFFERDEENWQWRGLEGIGPANRVETAFNSTVEDASSWRFQAEGQLSKESYAVDLSYADDRLEAALTRGNQKKDAEDENPFLIEHDTFLFLYSRALLAEQSKTYAMTLIDSRSLERIPVTIERAGIDTVLVPLGTFEAQRLVIKGTTEGRNFKRVVHITREAPFRVLQAAYFPEGIRYELLPKTLETVLREIQNQNEEP
jgi:hypothetical protein